MLRLCSVCTLFSKSEQDSGSADVLFFKVNVIFLSRETCRRNRVKGDAGSQLNRFSIFCATIRGKAQRHTNHNCIFDITMSTSTTSLLASELGYEEAEPSGLGYEEAKKASKRVVHGEEATPADLGYEEATPSRLGYEEAAPTLAEPLPAHRRVLRRMDHRASFGFCNYDDDSATPSNHHDHVGRRPRRATMDHCYTQQPITARFQPPHHDRAPRRASMAAAATSSFSTTSTFGSIPLKPKKSARRVSFGGSDTTTLNHVEEHHHVAQEQERQCGTMSKIFQKEDIFCPLCIPLS